eukprot:TRINITY_DN23204_c0_g1_i1.p1 TRINITY_DN23204_c0_g1~~TRINITY_DN23204_c0_g1_i1.p1  ORF type:complete len:589 (+),score=108.34 TRINITY_DN23204_c0_g1_i1:134-1900(+)
MDVPRLLAELDSCFAALTARQDALSAENKSLRVQLQGCSLPVQLETPELPSCVSAPEEFTVPPEPTDRLRKLSQVSDCGVATKAFKFSNTGTFKDLSLAGSKFDTLTKSKSVEDSKQKIGNLNDLVFAFADSEKKEEIITIRKTFNLEEFVKGFFFKTLCMTAIVANCIYLGVAADNRVKDSWRHVEGESPQGIAVWPDIAFVIWFTIEIIFRGAAEGRNFLFGREYVWNLFDSFLIGESIFSLIFNTGRKLTLLRILRVFRLVRVIRLVRTVKALRKLRTMIFSILNCFHDLLWAFVVVLLVMFVFSIIFDNAVSTYFEHVDIDNDDAVKAAFEIRDNFGSLYKTMVTLWCAISGGNDWYEYGDMLRRVDVNEMGEGEVYFLLFCFYVAFCLVGLLNVVTGIFVDSAVCTRSEDEIVECYTEDLERTTEEVRCIFDDADVDKSGTLTYEELRDHLQNPRVRAYFAGLDIDPSEVRIIFTLVDVDGDEEVTFEEFVNGMMRLKGPSKSLDVVSLMYDCARHADMFHKFCCYVEEQLMEITGMLKGVDPHTSGDAASKMRPPSVMLTNEKCMSRLRDLRHLGTEVRLDE